MINYCMLAYHSVQLLQNVLVKECQKLVSTL